MTAARIGRRQRPGLLAAAHSPCSQEQAQQAQCQCVRLGTLDGPVALSTFRISNAQKPERCVPETNSSQEGLVGGIVGGLP